jgi:hypothetical protein
LLMMATAVWMSDEMVCLFACSTWRADGAVGCLGRPRRTTSFDGSRLALLAASRY